METAVQTAGRVLMICALATACAPPNEAVPKTMVGVWRTSAPIYADRYLEVQPGFVTFATGKYTMDLRPIERVWSEPASPPDRGRLYTLLYRTAEGEPVELRLLHEAGPPPSLRLANRREVWTPDPNARNVHREGQVR